MAILLLASEDCHSGPMIGRWRWKAYAVEAGYKASAVIQSYFLKHRTGTKLKRLNYLQGRICFMYMIMEILKTSAPSNKH